MSRLGRKLASFLWWTYPRGGIEYDIMVALILAFIFLTPRSWFRDQPREPAVAPAGFAALAPFAGVRAADLTLDDVVAGLNQAAPRVTTLTAALANDTYDALTATTDTKTGTFYMKKQGAEQVQVAIDFDKPAAQIVLYRDHTLWNVQPALKTGMVKDLSGSNLPVESFLALGMGGSGSALQAAYSLRLEATPALDGTATAQLELIPNDPRVRDHFPRIELWLDPARDWVAVQQKFWQDKSNYTLDRYTAVKINPSIPDARFSPNQFKGIPLSHQ